MKHRAFTFSAAIGAACLLAGLSASAQTPTTPNPDSEYRLGPDSFPHDSVPKGEIKGPYTLKCNIYPGTQHT